MRVTPAGVVMRSPSRAAAAGDRGRRRRAGHGSAGRRPEPSDLVQVSPQVVGDGQGAGRGEVAGVGRERGRLVARTPLGQAVRGGRPAGHGGQLGAEEEALDVDVVVAVAGGSGGVDRRDLLTHPGLAARSEERRVGKGGRYRWSTETWTKRVRKRCTSSDGG